MYKKLALIILTLSFFAGCSSVPMVSDKKIEEYLPKRGEFIADIMQIQASEKIEEISTRMLTSFQKHKSWYAEYIENYPGKTLPYHEKIGISEAEYRYFLQNAKSASRLSKVGEVKISIDKKSNGEIVFKTNPQEFPLNGVTVYEKANYVFTNYAKLEQYSEIDQDEKDSVTGRWKGAQWKHEKLNGEKGVSVTLAIGKRTDQGDGIIYYDVKNKTSETHEAYYFILLYTL
jgi:hypothetical protein